MPRRLLPPSYINGFAPRDGVPLYDDLLEGCVGAWCPALGATGGTLYDWNPTPAKNHGTLTNMTLADAWTVREGRSALLFDGVNDFVEAPNITALHGISEFSASVWLRPTALTNCSVLTMWDYQTQGTFLLQYLSDGRIDVTIANAVNDAGNNYRSSSTNITAGQLWHVAFVYDGKLSAANRITIFINGVDASGTNNGTIPTSTTAGTATLKIGRIGGTLTQYASAAIYEVVIARSAWLGSDVRERTSIGPGGIFALADRPAVGAAADFNRRRRLLTAAGAA